MNFIHDICERYNITNYTINDDGSIDVVGNVNLCGRDLIELPLRFNKVTGFFSCSNNNLTSLKGSPRWIGNYFDCSNNPLTSLKGSPRWIGDDFYCRYNDLTSLEFGPDYVGGYFSCVYNKDLTDNYCDTEISGNFYTSLKKDGLIFEGNKATNYNEWRKLYKRKIILNELYTRYM
jgi:hypothetical protein